MKTIEISYRACKYCLSQLLIELETVFGEADNLVLKPTLIFNGKEDTLHSKNCNRPETKPKPEPIDEEQGRKPGTGLFG